MKYTDKSETLLKYQKAKAKLIEYDVAREEYPNFPINSNDLSFSTVYMLSLYAESIIEDDSNRQAELRPLLVKAAQYFDSAFESKERLQHDQDYLITGAVAYFLYNDFGSAKVLCSRLAPVVSPFDTPFQILALCLRYLLMNKTQSFDSSVARGAGVYESLVAYFSSGDDKGNITARLREYREYVFGNGNALDVFYTDLLYAICVFAMQKSAWQLLPRYSGTSAEVWKNYLERCDAVKMLWQSQELLCIHGVLRGQNAIVQLPTGVGKTKSIELIIRAAQLGSRASEVIIVAPLRALCNEITHDLQGAFRKDSVEISQFSDIMEDDYSFGAPKNEGIRISICTPEKLNYIIHHQPDICDMIGLFILDEAHMFDDGPRGAVYEFLVTTIRERLNDNQQLVLLSAVMTNANDIGQWLFGESGALATDDSITSTPKSVGFCNYSSIAYYSGDPLSRDYFVPMRVITQELRLFKKERKTRIFPENNSARDIALYYGIRLCKNGGVAVYVNQTASVRTTIERVVDIHNRGYNIRNISDNSNEEEMTKLRRLVCEYYGKDHVYTIASHYGILPHHSRLPNGVKLAVEYALREGKARFVVCTSTLAQGINIPIKYLLMTNINKGNEQMSIRSFQNLVGRTARAGMYTEGSVLITDPSLYTRRDKYEGGGRYKWAACCNMFSKSHAEPCKSSLLMLVSELDTGYDGPRIKVQKIVRFIVDHYEEADCFDVLQAKVIGKIGAEQNQHRKGSIASQLFQRKQVLEAIENYLCFVCETLSSSEKDIPENLSQDICKGTLAYYLANDDERVMLLAIFKMLGEKVTFLSKQQYAKYSAAMTGINCGKAIESWIREIDLVNHFYAEPDMLRLVVELYVSLYGEKIKEEELLLLCQKWIKGTMPLEMLSVTSFKEVDELMNICNNTISFNLSFLAGNIIDLLPEMDDEEAASVLNSALSLLQRKLKYGVPNLTAISICESVFWERYIAIEIARLIQDESVASSDLDVCLILNKDRICAYLEGMPSYFSDRFVALVSKKANT